MESSKDGTKAQSANKNGKKADSGSSSSGSFFTWFIVLALLGVWTSVAVVYFDLVDYQGVLDEKPGDSARTGPKTEPSPTKDVGWKLREALKQQLAIIHERVEAKKLAKLALAEVREILAKEAEEKELELGRKDISSKVKERVAARLKEEEEKMEKEEMEKLKKEKTNQVDDKKKDVSKVGDKKPMKVGEKEEKLEGEGKKAIKEDGEKGSESTKEKRKKSKEKSEGVKKK